MRKKPMKLEKLITPLELEELQRRMLLAVNHPREEVRKEFVCFVCAFEEKVSKYFEEYLYGRHDKATMNKKALHPWGRILDSYSKMYGVPKEFVQPIQVAYYSKHSGLLTEMLCKLALKLQGIE